MGLLRQTAGSGLVRTDLDETRATLGPPPVRNAPTPGGVEEGVAKTFTPRRIAAFTALWRALTQARRPGSPGLAERAGALPRMLGAALSGRYPGLGRGRLALIVLALAYLVSPVDLMPEMLLTVFGLGDDAVVALWLGGMFLAETDRFLGWERSRPVVVDGAPVPVR